MSQHQHLHTLPNCHGQKLPSTTRLAAGHHKKAAALHARPSKPSVTLAQRSSSHRPAKTGIRSHPDTSTETEDGELMASSFLQYCASCEKQIIVPSSGLLYCSERCRRADREKSVTQISEYNSPPSTPLLQLSFDEMPFPDIVPPRSPTTVPSSRSSIAFSPSTSPEPSDLAANVYHESDAARYLRQFQSATSNYPQSSRVRRPRYHRNCISVAAIPSAAPSLSHTPTSSSSYSMPYTPTARPLPPRQNPYSTSAGARSVDLVTPSTYTSVIKPGSLPNHYNLKGSASTHTSIAVADASHILYRKREPSSLSRGGSAGPSSLKQLFAFGAISTPSSDAEHLTS